MDVVVSVTKLTPRARLSNHPMALSKIAEVALSHSMSGCCPSTHEPCKESFLLLLTKAMVGGGGRVQSPLVLLLCMKSFAGDHSAFVAEAALSMPQHLLFLVPQAPELLFLWDEEP